MTVESVAAHLRRFSAAERIVTLEGSIATVELAAAAIGVEPDRIAKTLAIRLKGTERVVTVVTKGTGRLDNAKFKGRFGVKAGFVNADDCLAATGHPPGGVCPFGLREGVDVYLDESLGTFQDIYPAAGSPESYIHVTLEELVAWTAAEWVDVCR